MIGCEHFGDNYFNQLRLWASEHEAPLTVTFELTPFCNFNCVMCYVRLTKEQAKAQGEMLTAKEWIEIARQAKKMGTLNLALTGGEPLSHPDFWEIYGELNKMGFLISVLSNGSLIDEAAMEKFRRYGMPYLVKLTLYGASNETYRRVCGSDDGFTRISKAVDLLKEANVPVKMTATIVRENADDLQEIYRFAKEKGVPMQHSISVVKSSRGAVNTAESSRFAFSDFPDELSIEDLEKNKYPLLESPFAWCASYKTSFWMTWHGYMQMCSFMNTPSVRYSGNLVSDFRSLNSLLGKLSSPAECESCEDKEFCQRCPGILFAESGHPERISNSLCDTAKRLNELYKFRKGELI